MTTTDVGILLLLPQADQVPVSSILREHGAAQMIEVVLHLEKLFLDRLAGRVAKLSDRLEKATRPRA